jgi:hypothetical protein
VAAGAFEAVAARDSRLDGYAIARFEVLYVGAGPDDFAGAFVAQTVCCLDFEVSDAAGVPEVDVGAGRWWSSETQFGAEHVSRTSKLLTRKYHYISRGQCIRTAWGPTPATRPCRSHVVRP